MFEERIIMSEEKQITLEDVIFSNKKRDLLVGEWVIRIAALERTLIKKGILTQEELNESFKECIEEYGQVMASRRGSTN